MHAHTCTLGLGSSIPHRLDRCEAALLLSNFMAWPLRVYSCAIAFRNVLPLDSCFTEAKWTKLFTPLVYSVIGPRFGWLRDAPIALADGFCLFISPHAGARSVSVQVFWISLDLAWALEMDDLHAR